jgi:hypothetical protein
MLIMTTDRTGVSWAVKGAPIALARWLESPSPGRWRARAAATTWPGHAHACPGLEHDDEH